MSQSAYIVWHIIKTVFKKIKSFSKNAYVAINVGESMTGNLEDVKEVSNGNKWMDEQYRKHTGMSNKGHIFKKVI